MGVAVVGPKEKTPRVERGEGLKAVKRAGNKLEELGIFDFINSA